MEMSSVALVVGFFALTTLAYQLWEAKGWMGVYRQDLHALYVRLDDFNKLRLQDGLVYMNEDISILRKQIEELESRTLVLHQDLQSTASRVEKVEVKQPH
ncbi:MAG: hypothetical protein IMF09_00490 [Proteobacteria bacterium]|nr:hypothetical protein [Pseudomonadota bacterium]